MRSEAERGIRHPRNFYRGRVIAAILILPKRTRVQRHAALASPRGERWPVGPERGSCNLIIPAEEPKL